MYDFVSGILHFIFIFSNRDIQMFLNQTVDVTNEVYILFNLTFWLVLGVFFNFIYRGVKFIFRSLFGWVEVMNVLDIYNKIHQCIVDYWTMFIGSPVDSFTAILWDLVVYGTQFFIGFVLFYGSWWILRCLFGK